MKLRFEPRPPMPLAEKQRQIVARLLLIEDTHERLAAIVARGSKWPAIAPEQHTEEHRVPGCVSRLWLVGYVEDGVCRWRMDAESPLVKGLVALFCELSDGASPAEVAAFQPELVTALGLDRQLSPTRLTGLAAVAQTMRAFAQSRQPSVKLIDAHNHLHDTRLAPHRAAILPELARLGVTRCVANGTCEADWPTVAALAHEQPFVTPSFGLHPWHVAERSAGWLHALRTWLAAHPSAGIGEIGLDRWIKGHDNAAQSEVFAAQLTLAAELNRTVTIHCLRAWGTLVETLRTHAPPRGFLIHAFGGPQELVREFTALGGYFSFNAWFLHERKAKQREVFRHLPPDRVLIETDAPDMIPPDGVNAHPLRDAESKPINHPANLVPAYEALAKLRGEPVDVLAVQVAENFARLFG